MNYTKLLVLFLSLYLPLNAADGVVANSGDNVPEVVPCMVEAYSSYLNVLAFSRCIEQPGISPEHKAFAGLLKDEYLAESGRSRKERRVEEKKEAFKRAGEAREEYRKTYHRMVFDQNNAVRSAKKSWVSSFFTPKSPLNSQLSTDDLCKSLDEAFADRVKTEEALNACLLLKEAEGNNSISDEEVSRLSQADVKAGERYMMAQATTCSVLMPRAREQIRFLIDSVPVDHARQPLLLYIAEKCGYDGDPLISPIIKEKEYLDAQAKLKKSQEELSGIRQQLDAEHPVLYQTFQKQMAGRSE